MKNGLIEARFLFAGSSFARPAASVKLVLIAARSYGLYSLPSTTEGPSCNASTAPVVDEERGIVLSIVRFGLKDGQKSQSTATASSRIVAESVVSNTRTE